MPIGDAGNASYSWMDNNNIRLAGTDIYGRLSLTITSGTTGAAAGSNAGGSPPAPVLTGNDTRGGITFGTGTSPALGNLVAVTFAQAYAVAPIVVLTSRNTGTAALNLYVTSVGTGGFTITSVSAPAASQANTVYSVGYAVMS